MIEMKFFDDDGFLEFLKVQFRIGILAVELVM